MEKGVTPLLNHGEEFLGPLGGIQGMFSEVTFMHKFLSTSQAVSMKDSGSVVQLTKDAEYIISCMFAFQMFDLA